MKYLMMLAPPGLGVAAVLLAAWASREPVRSFHQGYMALAADTRVLTGTPPEVRIFRPKEKCQ